MVVSFLCANASHDPSTRRYLKPQRLTLHATTQCRSLWRRPADPYGIETAKALIKKGHESVIIETDKAKIDRWQARPAESGQTVTRI